jgi:hypothetical protein
MRNTNCFALICAGTVLSAATTVLGAESTLAPAPAPLPAEAAPGPGWRSLFDGKTLTGWKEADYSGKGPVVVTNGEIVLKSGYMTGIAWTNTKSLLLTNYEVALEARRIDGSDFFCGLTFPVNTNCCSLVVGGWGGSLVGLSCLDGADAANNETTKNMDFKEKKWYRIRVQVRLNRIRAWIDDEKLVDVDISERQVSIRLEMDACVPLGVATWSTTGGLRNIRVRPLAADEK